jgi:hypothetical protein
MTRRPLAELMHVVERALRGQIPANDFEDDVERVVRRAPGIIQIVLKNDQMFEVAFRETTLLNTNE